MTDSSRVELRFGPVSYVKPPGDPRPRTVDDLLDAIAWPPTEPRNVITAMLLDMGIAREVEGEYLICWPDVPPEILEGEFVMKGEGE